MATGMLQVQAIFAAAAPLPAPVENVPARSAPRTLEPPPPAATERHRPEPHHHLNRGPARLDHKALGGPGDPGERGGGCPRPRQRDGFAEAWEGLHGQARGTARLAA